MTFTIQTAKWQQLPTKRGAGFSGHPVKFVGTVVDADGKFIAATGKCATREAAQAAAQKLADKASA